MARAVSTTAVDTESGGVMLLAIDGMLWQVLFSQAQVEKSSPGAVLSKAVGQYLEKHGDEEIVRLFQAFDRE
jgi:hypothetical protein